MKKSLLIAVLGVGSVLAGHAQGVFFNNYYNSTQATGVTYGNGPLAGQGVGSSFTATLYYGAAGAADVSSLQPIGGPVTFVTSIGYPALPSGGALGGGSGAGWFGNPTINLPAYNTTYSLAIFVTGTYLGQTYSGYSPITQFTSIANSTIPTASLPDVLRKGTFSVMALPVPEPTTLALAGLGGLASLVMLRRKKA